MISLVFDENFSFLTVCGSNRNKIVNTFRRRTNSFVLERITQYNNRDIKARRRKEAPVAIEASQSAGQSPVAL